MRFLTVLTGLLVAIMGFYWWALTDIRQQAANLQEMRGELVAIAGRLAAADKALKEIGEFHLELELARRANSEKLLESMGLTGDARYDHLERMLREDTLKRESRNSGAASGANGSVH